jgi:hypothetical protein
MNPQRGNRHTFVDRRQCETTAVVTSAGTEVARWEIRSRGGPDLGLVNTLARLQLLAHRMGCTIEVRDPCPDLTRLLDLAGLAEVLGAPRVLRIEAVGETERGEQPAVEEVVVPDDPVA